MIVISEVNMAEPEVNMAEPENEPEDELSAEPEDEVAAETTAESASSEPYGRPDILELILPALLLLVLIIIG